MLLARSQGGTTKVLLKPEAYIDLHRKIAVALVHVLQTQRCATGRSCSVLHSCRAEGVWESRWKALHYLRLVLAVQWCTC